MEISDKQREAVRVIIKEYIQTQVLPCSDGGDEQMRYEAVALESAIYTYLSKPKEEKTYTDEEIESILVICFEGGSNWIDGISGHLGKHQFYSEAIVGGYEIEALVHAKKSRTYPPHETQTITKAKVIKGIKMYEAKNNKPFDFEFCTTDAGDADEVLQYALFGEIVFG